jgi:hypothetical protein
MIGGLIEDVLDDHNARTVTLERETPQHFEFPAFQPIETISNRSS